MMDILFHSRSDKSIMDSLSRFVAILGMIVCILLESCPAQEHTTCVRKFKKMGCFKEGNTKMDLIIYDRDGKGVELDWTQLKASIHSLACRCADKSKREGYQYFSIRFWAECWAGRSHAELEAVMKNESLKSTECRNHELKECDSLSKECVGKAYNEFMYSIAHWSAWGEWSACNQICGGGIQQRRRSCNTIEKVDTDCFGNDTESQTCNQEDCPTPKCNWIKGKMTIGSNEIEVSNKSTKEECLKSCLEKGNDINGINFFISPPSCNCVSHATVTSDANAFYCKLEHGLPGFPL